MVQGYVGDTEKCFQLFVSHVYDIVNRNRFLTTNKANSETKSRVDAELVCQNIVLRVFLNELPPLFHRLEKVPDSR